MSVIGSKRNEPPPEQAFEEKYYWLKAKFSEENYNSLKASYQKEAKW